MGFPGRHPGHRGYVHRFVIQRIGCGRSLADRERFQGGHHCPAGRGIRRRHHPSGRTRTVLGRIRGMRRLHGRKLRTHREVPQGRRLHTRRGQRPPSGQGLHRLHQSDQEIHQGEADRARRHRGQSQKARPLRRMVGRPEKIHIVRFQGGHNHIRDGRDAHPPACGSTP